MPLKLFISYAHADHEPLQHLLKVLRPLEREGLIAPWTDRLIDIGQDWRGCIDVALGDSQLGLLLLSIDFLASDFIDAAELKPLFERAERDEVELVPILLRRCPWEATPLGRLQPLPGWNRYIEHPEDSQAARDAAWTEIANRIRERALAFQAREPTASWDRAPYPGLRAFDEREAPIFTGRDDPTAALLQKLQDGTRFLAVYGASGSGKSSLVRAGLIPAWRRLPAGRDLDSVLIIKPDEDADGNPFTPLSCGLQPLLGPGSERAKLKHGLSADPGTIAQLIAAALRTRPAYAELLLVVDQFEEVFTTTQAELRQPFAAVLEHWLAHPRTRLVLTLRSDFFHRVQDFPALTERLNAGNGHFHVLPLGPEHYRALIEQPARLAGFRFDDELVDRLLTDAERGGSREGLVPLLQFALAKLYEPFGERVARGEAVPIADRCFSLAAYETFGGLQGAIASAAEAAVAEVSGAQEALPRLFRALVTMNHEQQPTRRRALRSELERDPETAALVRHLVGDQSRARLLIAQESHVEVAHEILFKAWAAMADWIIEFRHDLQLRDRMSYEARQWEAVGRNDPHLLWSHERQQPLFDALRRLGQPPESWTEEPERSFLRPEAERLLDEIADPGTDHRRRDWIGLRWAAIGDPRPGIGCDAETGLPDILWSEVILPGEVELEGGAGRFVIEQPFRIAVYPVTRAQYGAFLDATDGYEADAWWTGLTRPDPRWPPTGAGGNYPVGLVTWDEAVAFCRWLDHALRARGLIVPDQQLRLPTEWEWQQAVTGGDQRRDFPWAGTWAPAKLNSLESRLVRTVAVGLYPGGAAACGALDLAGNVWEWCSNRYDKGGGTGAMNADRRAVRGGSWLFEQDKCRAAFRNYDSPWSRDVDIGFRVCLSSPIR
ncbi:MAG: TIR domain-containing protein [Gammaproteobacteria bacterium]|nr:TIR domain-containing protein [Gammaproteobacteria bacterium]